MALMSRHAEETKPTKVEDTAGAPSAVDAAGEVDATGTRRRRKKRSGDEPVRVQIDIDENVATGGKDLNFKGKRKTRRSTEIRRSARESSAINKLGMGEEYEGTVATAAVSNMLGFSGEDGLESWAEIREVFFDDMYHNALKLLPILLRVSFVAFPAVTSLALRAFLCESFDTIPEKLIADYSVSCGSEEHKSIKRLAWGGITIYGFGIPVMYLVLLAIERRSLLMQRPTKLAKALAFLHKSYLPHYWYWELLEVFKRLYLMGFCVFIDPGSITQLMVSALVCLVYVAILTQASPMKNPEDDYIALSTNFGLACFFLFALILKMGDLAETLRSIVGREPLRRCVWRCEFNPTAYSLQPTAYSLHWVVIVSSD